MDTMNEDRQRAERIAAEIERLAPLVNNREDAIVAAQCIRAVLAGAAEENWARDTWNVLDVFVAPSELKAVGPEFFQNALRIKP